MGILVGVVVIVLAMVALCSLTDNDGNYEEYRRTEYRNEYLYEKKKHNDDNYYLDAMMIRRP